MLLIKAVRKIKMEYELYHWLKKGEQKDDHKYIRRELINGKWRYWYDQPKQKDSTVDKNEKNTIVSKGYSYTREKLLSFGNTFISSLPSAQKKALQVSILTANSSDYSKKYDEKKYNAFITSLDKLSTTLSRKIKETSKDEDMALVNPMYKTKDVGNYNDNCALCTLAYDLRRRGYDVEASSDAGVKNSRHDSMTSSEIARCYVDNNGYSPYRDYVNSKDISKKYNIGKNAEMSEKLSYLEKDMLSHGNGSRGELGLYWSIGGGHSVVWEVEQGSVIIRDCQSNTKHTLDEYSELINDFDYLRLDNLQPSAQIVKYVKRRMR